MLVPGYRPEFWEAASKSRRDRDLLTPDPVVHFPLMPGARAEFEERGRLRYLEIGSGSDGSWERLQRCTLWHDDWNRLMIAHPGAGKYRARMLWQAADGVWHQEWSGPFSLGAPDDRAPQQLRRLRFGQAQEPPWAAAAGVAGELRHPRRPLRRKGPENQPLEDLQTGVRALWRA